MENPVDHDLIVDHFEVKTPFLRTETIEGLAVALDAPKAFVVEVLQIILGDLELIEQGLLFQSVQLRDLGRTDFVEDDL